MRLRLGAGGPPDTAACGLCGHGVLDASGDHAARCATGEATRAHNKIRDILYEHALQADASTEREPLGLVPDCPTLRPADVLTSAALDGCAAALDVGITASGAADTDGDRAEAMYTRKREERRNIEETLAAQHIRYEPVMWTSFGRPHEAPKAVMQRIARRVARRRGIFDSVAVYRGMCRAISAELARRTARMSIACWPAPSSADSGDTDSDDDDDSNATDGVPPPPAAFMDVRQ